LSAPAMTQFCVTVSSTLRSGCPRPIANDRLGPTYCGNRCQCRRMQLISLINDRIKFVI
jgi:hypothetical protein